MFDWIVLAIGISAGVLTLFLTAREALQFKQVARQWQAQSAHLHASLQGLARRSSTHLEDIDTAVSEITREMKAYEFVDFISNVSGRLVFELRHMKTMHSVIVKMVLEEKRLVRSRYSLFNEAFVLSHLGGLCAPRLVRVSVTSKGRPFLVREALPGIPLDQALSQLALDGRPPRYSEVHALLSKVAEAVEKIHAAGVTHGDIKPANILIESGRRGDLGVPDPQLFSVYLLDFESAVVTQGAVIRTTGDVTRGTPFFMAPERYAYLRLSEASDVYSCSALTSLMLTGRPDRPGSSAGERIKSAELRNAIRRGMSFNVGERHSGIAVWWNDVGSKFLAMIGEYGDGPVDWPRDPRSFEQELSMQATSITLSALGRGTFRRFASSLDAPTLERSLQERFNSLDERTRRLVELVWMEGVGVEEAAAQLLLDPEVARSDIENFLEELDVFVRRFATSKEQAAHYQP